MMTKFTVAKEILWCTQCKSHVKKSYTWPSVFVLKHYVHHVALNTGTKEDSTAFQ